MIVDIGKDCWDMILEMKYGLEHREKYEKCLNDIRNRLDCLDNIVRCVDIQRTPKPQFVILSKQYIIDYCFKHRRTRNHLLRDCFINRGHYRLNIIVLGDISNCREVPMIIRDLCFYHNPHFHMAPRSSGKTSIILNSLRGFDMLFHTLNSLS